MIIWTVTTVRDDGGDARVEFWYVVAHTPKEAARQVLEEFGVYGGHRVVAVHAGCCTNHGEATQNGRGDIIFQDGDAARWV